MPTEVLKDVKIYYEELDLSGQSNEGALEYEVEPLDDTVFGDTTRSAKGGLLSCSMVVSGFVDLDEAGQDERLFAELNTQGEVMSIIFQGEAENNVGYMFQPLLHQYDLTGELGTLFAFEIEATNRGAKLIRATMLGAELTATANGTSTARQLGAVTASQRVYAAIHVLSVSGSSPTLNVLLRSDDSSGMGTPTTQITFSEATAAISQFLSAAGAIDDDWWDISFTITGGSPSFRFVVIVGIL